MARWSAIFCAVLLVAVAACWVTMSLTFHRAQAMYFTAGRNYNVELRPWGFHLSTAKYDRGYPTGQHQPSGGGWMFTNEPSVDRTMYAPPQWMHLGLALGMSMRDELYGGPTTFVTIPYWLASLVPACVCGATVRRWRQQRRRSRVGLCPVCGYDLRATPERCPECGRAASRLAPAAASS